MQPLAVFRIVPILLLPALCFGQGDRGLISGRVMDSSKAVIPGLTVQLKSVETGRERSTTTNDAGVYVFDYLTSGTYVLETQNAGFRPYSQPDIVVRVNDRLNIDIVLAVGTAADQITVTSGAPVLETSSAAIGAVVDNRRIRDLPLIYGNPFMLELLMPGIVFQETNTAVRTYDSGSGNVSINGSMDHAIEYQLDGVPDTSKRNSAYTPSTEFVQEYRVETSSYDASQGRSSGGWVNASLKSGTNAFHGSAFGYYQNRGWNANTFIGNMTGTPDGNYQYNRIGGVIGGPVVRNKTFFFVGYERIRNDTNAVKVMSVPPLGVRSGDLSSLLKIGSQYQIYDPYSTTSVQNRRLA